ncbi:MAG: hypothetical protein J7M18_03875, partial [Candidatus Eremiobacteraeota bacterium]|nr:hypothetical protein [Candidatus Eremiobacteraeota bacterium]
VRAVTVDPDNPGILYAGTDNSIYKTVNGGKYWKSIFNLRGTWKAVNNILVHPKNSDIVMAATQNGLYISRDGGKTWNISFRGIGTFQRDILHVESRPDNPDFIYAGSVQGLFNSEDGGITWVKSSGKVGNLLCRWISVNPDNPDIVYVATNQGVFRSRNKGNTWDKIYTVSEDIISYDEVDPEEFFADEEILDVFGKVRCVIVDPLEPKHLYLACFNGVFFSPDEGKTWSRMPETGLTYSNIKMVALPSTNSYRPIFASSDRGAFIYSDKSRSWSEIYEGISNRDFRYLSIDNKKPGILWAAVKGGIYKAIYGKKEKVVAQKPKPLPSPEKELTEEEEILRRFAHEPGIVEVQKVAINYAEVNPEKIARWRRQSRLRHFLPYFSIKQEKDMTIDVKGSSSNPFYVIGPDNKSVDYSLSWDLGNLVWSTDQTSIDVRSRLMVQLRGDVLDEVTKTYFERRRIQVDMITNPPKSLSARLKKQLRLQELTAQIDALTGGWFSAEIERRKNAGGIMKAGEK